MFPSYISAHNRKIKNFLLSINLNSISSHNQKFNFKFRTSFINNTQATKNKIRIKKSRTSSKLTSILFNPKPKTYTQKLQIYSLGLGQRVHLGEFSSLRQNWEWKTSPVGTVVVSDIKERIHALRLSNENPKIQN
jgi:hypothetical protein